MTSLALRAVNQIIYTASLKRFIDGHNNDTLGYEQCVQKMYSFMCVLKCLSK